MSYQDAQANHDLHSALINALAQHAQEQQARQAYLGTERLTLRVRQTSHGLAVGNVVRHNGTAWIKAQADTAANGAATAVVEQVIGDRFRLVLAGRIRGLSGLTAGSIHYLSAATAGALTTTAPALAVPILRALTTTEGVVLMQMGATASGLTIPSSDPLRTSIYSTGGASGTHTVGSNTSMLFVSVVGAGGGGGISEAPSTSYAIIGGGGGGAGCLIHAAIKASSGDAFSYSVGSGGGFNAGAGGNGAAGGSTTFGPIIAGGGAGGTAGSGSASIAGNGGDGGKIGYVTPSGSPYGLQWSTPGQSGGSGRSRSTVIAGTPVTVVQQTSGGRGGVAPFSSYAGGAGGRGGYVDSSTRYDGTNGSAGLIIVNEY